MNAWCTYICSLGEHMSFWCTHTWSTIVANNSLRRTDKQIFWRTNLIYVYGICTAMCVRRDKKLSRIQFNIQTMYLVTLYILVRCAYIYSIWPLGVQMYAWCTYMFVWMTVSCVYYFVQKINLKFALYVGDIRPAYLFAYNHVSCCPHVTHIRP